MCDSHHEPLKLFCITENKPCCIVCDKYDNLHKGHVIKSVRIVLETAAIELANSLRETEQKVKSMEDISNEMLLIKQRLEDEQGSFISNLNSKVEVII